MKFLIATVLVILIAVSFYADYKWKQWIARQKQQRDHPPNSFGENGPK